MICPHCKKYIPPRMTKECLKRARQLREVGHSLRKIEMLLELEGHHANYATLSRHLSKK